MSDQALVRQFARLPAHVRRRMIHDLPPTEFKVLQAALSGVAEGEDLATIEPSYPWQAPPDWDWWGWAIVGGRGIGKTLGAAAWIDQQAQHFPGIRVGIIAPTQPDARATCVEGETGLLAVNPRIRFNRSNLELHWDNGSQARCFGAYTREDRERLRGPQYHRAWLEEFAAWRQLDEEPTGENPDAYEHVTIGLRLGRRPRFVMGSTPKRRRRYVEVTERADVAVTRATTYQAHGLPDAYRARLLELYEDTRLGRQELLGEVLDDVVGAGWTSAQIEQHRVDAHPPLHRVAVGVDPSGSRAGTAGIVAAGVSRQRWPHPASGRLVRHAYVLADESEPGRAPEQWAAAAVDLAKDLGATIYGERNYGGDMVASTIRGVDVTVPFDLVTASRGKVVRAEPVAALAAQGILHHVGRFPKLEDEQTTYTDESPWSPNRLDAMVWAVTALMPDLQAGESEVVVPHRRTPGTGRTQQTRRTIRR